jgi:hypothetical protein
MPIDEKKRAENAEKALLLAAALYPSEKWEFSEVGIYIAKSRLPKSTDQYNILVKELAQARLLVARGSTVYLLPEIINPIHRKEKHPDAVVDGTIMEFKTVTGGLPKVIKRYKEGRDKASIIFLKIDAPHTRHAVMRALSGYIRKKGYTGGTILVYFTKSEEFFKWTEDELAKKNPALTSRQLPGKNGETAVHPFTPR